MRIRGMTPSLVAATLVLTGCSSDAARQGDPNARGAELRGRETVAQTAVHSTEASTIANAGSVPQPASAHLEPPDAGVDDGALGVLMGDLIGESHGYAAVDIVGVGGRPANQPSGVQAPPVLSPTHTTESAADR